MQNTNLNIPNADQSLQVMPVANEIATLSSVNVQGITISPTEREFLVNLNLTSNTGAPQSNSNDKVVCFAGLNAAPGTSDVWTYYSTMGLLANSGDYNAIGYEVDLNNKNKNMGNSGSLGVDLGSRVSMGVTSTGAGDFTCTAAFLASSQAPTSNPQWGRGYVTAGQFAVCDFQSWSNSPVGLQFDGNYGIATINLTSLYGNPGAVNQTALLMRNSQTVCWQNNTLAGIISDSVDGTNNRIVGAGASIVTTGAPLAPLAAGFDLGTAGNYWGRIWSPNGVVNPSDLSLKKDVSRLASVCDKVKSVHPIQFRWRDDDTSLHYGFDANQIRDSFESDFAGHMEVDGVQHIAKDQLIAVLWKANQELLDRVERLEHAHAHVHLGVGMDKFKRG